MSVFHFKQFSVRQTNAAMKVGTDAMVLGSLCDFENATRLLDIGTGTGVLSLMMAQRFPNAAITAVEIEASAAEDARFNFTSSPFSNRLSLHESDVRSFSSELFDGIIANPPYFEDSYKSDSGKRNLARHTDELPFTELMSACSRLLTVEGTIWIIIPPEAVVSLTTAASSNGFSLLQHIHIHGKPGKPVRAILQFGRMSETLKESTFTVRKNDGSYSEEYIALTRDFHAVDLSVQATK